MSERTRKQIDELTTLTLELQLAAHKYSDKKDPAYVRTKSLADSLVDVVRSMKLEVNG